MGSDPSLLAAVNAADQALAERFPQYASSLRLVIARTTLQAALPLLQTWAEGRLAAAHTHHEQLLERRVGELRGALLAVLPLVTLDQGTRVWDRQELAALHDMAVAALGTPAPWRVVGAEADRRGP